MDFLILLLILGFTISNWRALRRFERIREYREKRHLDEQCPFRSELPFVFLIALGFGGFAWADEPRTKPPLYAMHIKAPVRNWYRNQPDFGGSCVQMSLGMCGCQSNDENAACLPFDSVYGEAVRGGSLPSRVERSCDARGIRAFNVTGRSIDDTMPWIEWAGKTGRFAAVGFTEAHFQTLYGFDHAKKEFYVCDNNSPSQVSRYTEQQFREKHRACMPWCVILEKPSSPPPNLDPWWK